MRIIKNSYPGTINEVNGTFSNVKRSYSEISFIEIR